MRQELSGIEWTAIKPMLPDKTRGVRRVNDRRALNGTFWVLRSGAAWPTQHLPSLDPTSGTAASIDRGMLRAFTLRMNVFLQP
jgi:transposase